MNDNHYRRIIDLLNDLDNPKKYYSVSKNFDNPKYLNPESCAKCKGICCISSGCLISPDDFNLKDCFTNEILDKDKAYQILEKEIRKGYISIEEIDGDQVCVTNGIIYILHVRDYDAPIGISLRKEKHSHCILLTDNGCPFTYEERPTGGKMLVPNYPECESDYNLRDCCKEWLPFQYVLRELYQKYRYRKIKCSI